MLSYKIFAFLALTALAGCAHHVPKEPPAPPASAPEAKAVPEKPVSTQPRFSLDLSNGWEHVATKTFKPKLDEMQLIALFENDVAEDVSAVTGVLAAPLSEAESETFLDDIRSAAKDREDAYLVKERKLKLGETAAYEFLDVRNTPDGPRATVSVALAAWRLGYLVTCFSGMETAQATVPVCVRFVESFRVKE